MAAARTLAFGQDFLDELLKVEQYLGRFEPRRGRLFTKAVVGFAYETIGPLPEAFPRYQHPLLPDVALRRAVFRREYALLYRVTDEEVVLVYFYFTRRDISQQALKVD